MEPKKRLRTDQRIRKQTAFQKLAEKGVFVRGEIFYLWVSAQKDVGQSARASRPMIGIAIGRSACASATQRNLFKRRVREIFRKHQQRLRAGVACLVKARKQKKDPLFGEMEQELVALFKKAGAWE